MLALMIGAKRLSTIYEIERRPPKVDAVETEVTSRTVAPGATAPDHSTSNSASTSGGLKYRTPGSTPLMSKIGSFAGNWNIWRKVRTSDSSISESDPTI